MSAAAALMEVNAASGTPIELAPCIIIIGDINDDVEVDVDVDVDVDGNVGASGSLGWNCFTGEAAALPPPPPNSTSSDEDADDNEPFVDDSDRGDAFIEAAPLDIIIVTSLSFTMLWRCSSLSHASTPAANVFIFTIFPAPIIRSKRNHRGNRTCSTAE